MSASPVAEIADVLITAQLARRTARAAEFAAESRALGKLLEALSEPPASLLQKVCDAACSLCNADSAGASMPDGKEGEVLVWRAASGPLAPNVNAAIPRAGSPCSLALDLDATALLANPQRRFDYGRLVMPPVVEQLILPCRAAGRPVGTLWVALHSESRGFDAEDERLLQSLARVAAHAMRVLGDPVTAGAAQPSLQQSEATLAESLRAMRSLHRLSVQWTGTATSPAALLEDVLDAALEMVRADFGNIQLCEPARQTLEIKAQRGFEPAFLELIRVLHVSGTSTPARAIRERRQIVLEDIELEPSYRPYLQMAAAAGFRAVVATPLQSRGGEIIGALCTHFRRRCHPSETQLQVLQLYAQLIADVIERARLLESLEEGDRRKTEFLATLAHELRNPLAPIRNALRILQLRGSQPRVAAQSRAVIERQLGQLVRLVDDLLDVARISTGKLDLRTERVDLSRVVKIAVESSRPMVQSGEHELIVQLPPYPIFVDADATRLAQVLLNLINNAAKYSTRRGWILLAVTREENEAVIRVKDRGVGIDPAMLGRIFDLFVQLDSSISRSGGGLGVGLTLVKRVVELHGGRVEVHSDGPGQGSEFIVRLPLSVALTVPVPAAADRNGTRRTPHLRVLIVDDNVDAADSLAVVVSLCGHDTRTANDGIQALEVARAFEPDVMVLDLGLPRLSGYEVARRVRADPKLKHITLVALTGWGQPEDRERGREAGIDHYMVKPADLDAFERILEEVPAAAERPNLIAPH